MDGRARPARPPHRDPRRFGGVVRARPRRHGRPGTLSSGPAARFPAVTVVLACAVWANELTYQLYWFFVGGWSVSSALMIQMCGLSILFLPVMFFIENEKVRQALFDILWFWGIGGAVQALDCAVTSGRTASRPSATSRSSSLTVSSSS